MTINIILNRIYNRKEITTDISRLEIKELFYFCAEDVNFSFDNKIYIKNNGIALGSPFGPILANILMADFERSVMPSLASRLNSWRRYINGTIYFTKADLIEYVLSKLNSFHKIIQFNVEVEREARISFLDVLVVRDKTSIKTTVQRTSTNISIYLNWKSCAPNKWKIGIFRTLFQKSYDIFSTE